MRKECQRRAVAGLLALAFLAAASGVVPWPAHKHPEPVVPSHSHEITVKEGRLYVILIPKPKPGLNQTILVPAESRLAAGPGTLSLQAHSLPPVLLPSTAALGPPEEEGYASSPPAVFVLPFVSESRGKPS